jgi:biotin carboxylase
MHEGTVLIIGGRTEALSKAVDLGLRVVMIQHKDRLAPEHTRIADAVLVIDYLDWAVLRPLVEAAHAAYGFDHVVSLVEQGTEIVGRINDLLGLEGTPHRVAHLFRDKWAMRQHLAAKDLGSVGAALVDGCTSLSAFGREYGYPFVVKPVDGTASRGVLMVDEPSSVTRVWREIEDLRSRQDLTLGKFFPIDRFVMEEYVDGPELSVESFSFSGRHVVVAITEKLTLPNFIEIGHAQPARLSAGDEEAIVRHVTEFLDAVGLEDGVAHTEIRMSARGPRVIESHDRVGGDRIGDLVHAAFGIDLELYAIGWPFRLVPELATRPQSHRASATRFLMAQAGTVVDIRGAQCVRDHADVIGLDIAVGPGDTVAVLTDSFDRVGQVLTVGRDTASAVRRCEQFAAAIDIVTEPLASGATTSTG